MPTALKLWRIEQERPMPIEQQKLDMESRLENWLRDDIGLVSDDLLLIGQQVPTSYGGKIDLLAIDPMGNLVILELKRDKTPRDIVAQTLDYASWVEKLSHETIQEIANDFLKGKSLDQEFRDKFESELPDVLNERHRMYVVASSIDSATERIVKYLSETHSVDINVATFAYFKPPEGEFIGRSMLLDEEQVLVRAEGTSKRKPPLTWDELRSLAEQNGVLPLYEKVFAELRPLVDGMNRTRSSVALIGYMDEDKARSTLFGIYPGESSKESGLAIMFLFDRLCRYFNISEGKIRPILRSPAKNVSTYDPSKTYFLKEQDLNELIALLSQAKQG
jgi:hypothetical protein